VTQLDDALLEARLAREAMLLYIQVCWLICHRSVCFSHLICLFTSCETQFIKDCAYDAALSENATAATIPGTKPDISLR
jgi:hypothetical protein